MQHAGGRGLHTRRSPGRPRGGLGNRAIDLRAFKLHAERLCWAGRAEDLRRQFKVRRLQGVEADKLSVVKLSQEEN